MVTSDVLELGRLGIVVIYEFFLVNNNSLYFFLFNIL